MKKLIQITYHIGGIPTSASCEAKDVKSKIKELKALGVDDFRDSKGKPFNQSIYK